MPEPFVQRLNLNHTCFFICREIIIRSVNIVQTVLNEILTFQVINKTKLLILLVFNTVAQPIVPYRFTDRVIT